MEALEIQVAEMRSLLAKYRQLYPDGEKSGRLDRIPTLGTNFAPTTADADQVSPSSIAESRAASSSSTPSPHLPIHRPYISVSPVPTPALTDEDPDCDLSDDEVTVRRALVLPFTRMTLKYDEENFQGKASSMMFVKAALHSKQRSLDASNQDIHTPEGGDDVGDAVLNGKSSSGPSLNEKTDAWKGKEVRKGVARTPAEDYGIRFHSEHPQVWSDHEVRCTAPIQLCCTLRLYYLVGPQDNGRASYTVRFSTAGPDGQLTGHLLFYDELILSCLPRTNIYAGLQKWFALAQQ